MLLRILALIPALLLAPLAAHAQSAAGASAPNYAPSMSRLMDAAQRLREAIQAMAAQPAGEARNSAMRTAADALYDAQSAMIALPPELRTGAPGERNPTKAMERLQQAAEQLRESVQAMSQQPAGPRRSQAAEAAREALLETQQAMLELPR